MVRTHSFRHACATEMLRGGASVRHVQEMLGHSHITTTQLYTQVVPFDLKKVHHKTAPSERRGTVPQPLFNPTSGYRDRTQRLEENQRLGQPVGVKQLTLYLDTSVIGGYFDTEFEEPTRELWRQMEAGNFRFIASVTTADEIFEAPEQVRDLFKRTFEQSGSLIAVTQEMLDLALAYLSQGVVSAKFADDAKHVAACTIASIDFLVSWNFKHLVSVHRSAAFNAVNLLHGYPPVRIVSPLELIYGAEDKDL